MTSRFVQLCGIRPQGSASDQLLALDDDGMVWIWLSGDGWRIWADQRSHGLDKPPVHTVATEVSGIGLTVQDQALITHTSKGPSR